MCVCVCVLVIFAYYCVRTYKWHLTCACMKVHASCDKFEVVSWMYETRCVAKVSTDWPRRKNICFFIYSFVCACVYACVWWWFLQGTTYHHHCIRNKVKFRFVSIIGEGVWCARIARNIMVMRYVILQYTMEYYATLVIYAGISFVLGCNKNLY